MSKYLYAIHDSKVGAYMPPMAFRSNGEAIRSFLQMADDPQGIVGKFPHDFTLMKLGEWDERLGKITAAESKDNLGSAAELRPPQETQEPLFTQKTNLKTAKEN